MKTLRRLATCVILALLPGVSTRADGLPDLGELERGGMSTQAERRLGERYMLEIRRDPSYVDDPEVAAYVGGLGERLIRQLQEVHPEFEFFAIRDAMLNAFALPGGFIGVHTGLLLAARNESELAGVLAHEISHVTQSHLARMFGSQSQAQLATLLSLAAALLAARSNPDMAIGAIMAGQAGLIQNQLKYSRDFEREADRLGLDLMERAGYDIRGMASFFDQMLQFGRLYESKAPGYLRTHPLTTERISDMQNRIAMRVHRTVPDSPEFGLIQAKVRAYDGSPGDALAYFQARLRADDRENEAITRFGLAHALLRDNRLDAVEAELNTLRRLRLDSPLLENLAAQWHLKRKDSQAAMNILVAGVRRYPESKALKRALIEAKLGAGGTAEAAEALALLQKEIDGAPGDARLLAWQAKAYALMGKRLQQHRTQAESYLAEGRLEAAIMQLDLARQANDGDFYEQSQVDARLRELKLRKLEEMRRQ